MRALSPIVIVLGLATTTVAQPGAVRTIIEIRSGESGFTGALDDNDRFGQSSAGVGDVDGDGTVHANDLQLVIDGWGHCR